MRRTVSILVIAAAFLAVMSGPGWSESSDRALERNTPAHPATPVKAGDILIAKAHHWSAWMIDGKLVFIEDDGGGFNAAIIVNRDTIDFGMTSLVWRVVPGSTYDMQINIDGQVFSGTAVGTNDTTIQMRDINNRFLQNLYWGQKAYIRVNQYDLVLSLTGSKAIIDAGLRYARGY